MAYEYNNYNDYSSSGDNRQKQEEEKRKTRRVYSTALINELVKERNLGYDIPYDAFFMRDLDLRAPNVTFRMTDEEVEEYQMCYDDALYYVENYCKFMTDKGMDLVQLRDFQKNVVKTVTDEVYIDELDDYGPKNRNVIWMASRQSGKCCSPCMEINKLEKNPDLSSDQNNKIPISDIYYIGKTKLSLFDRVKKYLYKLYNKL